MVIIAALFVSFMYILANSATQSA